ncbi:MAG: helix-turn-helix transcriptional regulator [Gammaproteobacteria bacterium]|nr:helix-turn-helix transcriptional regulator [Gammaproteobacteria bacterium]
MHQLVTYNALVGYEIESFRKEKSIEQKDLANKTGISQPVLSRLEKGKASITIDQLFVISEALGTYPQEIIRKAYDGVLAIRGEDSIDVDTSKKAGSNNAGALLTGAAIGAVLTLLLARGK